MGLPLLHQRALPSVFLLYFQACKLSRTLSSLFLTPSHYTALSIATLERIPSSHPTASAWCLLPNWHLYRIHIHHRADKFDSFLLCLTHCMEVMPSHHHPLNMPRSTHQPPYSFLASSTTTSLRKLLLRRYPLMLPQQPPVHSRLLYPLSQDIQFYWIALSRYKYLRLVL